MQNQEPICIPADHSLLPMHCDSFDILSDPENDAFIMTHHPDHPRDVELAFRVPRKMVIDFSPSETRKHVLSARAIPEISRLLWGGEGHDEDLLLLGQFDRHGFQGKPIFTLCTPAEATHIYVSKPSDAYPNRFGRYYVPSLLPDDVIATNAVWHYWVDDLARSGAWCKMPQEEVSQRRDYGIFELGFRATLRPSKGSPEDRTVLIQQSADDYIETRRLMIAFAEQNSIPCPQSDKTNPVA